VLLELPTWFVTGLAAVADENLIVKVLADFWANQLGLQLL
jgi:hypothetical protein